MIAKVGINMGIRFLLGRSGTGKSSWIRDDIKQNVLTEPRGAPIFYIVPDQMSFQQERALFHQEDLQGSIRAQVVSFHDSPGVYCKKPVEERNRSLAPSACK